MSPLAGSTAPEGPSSTTSTRSKERCWGGQCGSVSGMAERLTHGADPGDPRTASLVTSHTGRRTLGHRGHTHKKWSESHRSPWWGQEPMQIPCVRAAFYFSQVGGWPRSTLPARNGSPGACQPMPNTPFVFVPCSARRWDSGLITDGRGQFVTSTHGSSAHTRDLCSHSSPCPQTVSTDASPYGNAFATSKRLKILLHQGQANVGWGEREDNSVGGCLNQTPPDSVRPSSS